MFWKICCFYPLLFAALAGAEFRWNPGRAGTIAECDGRKTLTVRVEPGDRELPNCAEAGIDLVPFRGTTVGFRIPIRAEGVTPPRHNYNGVKFMLHFIDGSGEHRYYNIQRCHGSFDWQEFAFSAPIPPDATRGRIMLGLQESSGTVAFDLNRLAVKVMFRPDRSRNRISYPENVLRTLPLRGVMSPTRDFTEDDWKTLKAWNVNLVRVQLCREQGMDHANQDPAEYDSWLDSRLDHYEKMFKSGHEKYGLRFIIDLHTPPGGRNAFRDTRMLHEPGYADHFIEVWKKIARRFRGNPAVWAYDLVNEPNQSVDAPNDYRTLQRRAAEAVRAIDPDTPIIVESNRMADPGAFDYLAPLEMDNIIYQCHMYIPGSYTHQNVWPAKGETQVLAYPGQSDGKYYDKEAVREALRPVRDFQLRHNARIYVGEFSVVAWAPNAEKLLADYIDLFEEYGWDWTYHAFREWDGWSVEHEGENAKTLRPASDTPRKRVLLEGLKRNFVNPGVAK